MNNRTPFRLSCTSFLFSLLLVTLCGPGADADSDESVGMRLFREKRYAQAVPYLLRAVKENPASVDCHNSLGSSYYHNGDFQPALAEFQKCLQLDPHAKINFRYVATIYTALGRRRESVKVYGELIRKDPKDPDLYYGRAQALVGMLSYPQAVSDYSTAISLDSGDFHYFNDRAIAYMKLKQYQKAADDYTKCAKLKPGRLETYLGRGDCYVALGKYNQAVADYTKAIELNPERTRGYVARAIAYEKNGQADLAAADRKRLKEKGDTFD